MRPSKSLLHRLIAHVMLPIAFFRGLPGALRETRTGETEPIDPTTRFEHTDINMSAVLLTGLGLLLSLWAITALVYPFFSYLKQQRAVSSPPPLAVERHGNPMPPQPRIQDNPRQDLRDMRAYENTELTGYRWVDRNRGLAAIPIDEAIRMVARHGIPAQPAPPGLTYFEPHAGSRLTGFEGKVEPEPR